MEKKLLSKEELDLYDYVKLKNLIEQVFKLFNYIKLINRNAAIPKITQDYRVRYEQFMPVRNSAVEHYALKELMIEINNLNFRKKLLSKITLALRNLNKLELQVFKLTFYESKTEDQIQDIVHYGVQKVRAIKKSGAIKFLSALNLNLECFK